MKPHDTNLIAAVREFIAQQRETDPRFTEAQFARLARVTHAALSTWLQGKYAANPANIEAKFRDVLEGRATSNRLPDAKPLANPVTEEVAALLDVARNTDTIGVAHGRAGIGKTVALDLYVAQNPRTILVKLTPESASGPGLRSAIHRALGQPKGSNGETMFESCVAKVKNAEQLFVFDDENLPAHLLLLIPVVLNLEWAGG
jgi:DNA transposition AAA+ family ATPase